ncbi:hypothetical protein ACFW9N_28245 [Streptomyces sp. NPDC059496]|uniref:hypothetical protein n=1 Tax=Streptomyces sp. NPDC059496 TaxID=3346851 RepID=UPI003681ADF8
MEAAEEIIADPGSTTFRTLERRRQAVCAAMEQQARSTAADRLKSSEARAYFAAEDELQRLLQLTQRLFQALRGAEELLPPVEAVKAAKSRCSARIDQIATERYGSLPTSGDGAHTKRRAWDAARRPGGASSSRSRKVRRNSKSDDPSHFGMKGGAGGRLGVRHRGRIQADQTPPSISIGCAKKRGFQCTLPLGEGGSPSGGPRSYRPVQLAQNIMQLFSST